MAAREAAPSSTSSGVAPVLLGREAACQAEAKAMESVGSGGIPGNREATRVAAVLRPAFVSPLYALLALESVLLWSGAWITELWLTPVAQTNIVFESALFLGLMAASGLLHLGLFRFRHFAVCRTAFLTVQIPVSSGFWGSHIVSRYPFLFPGLWPGMLLTAAVACSLLAFLAWVFVLEASTAEEDNEASWADLSKKANDSKVELSQRPKLTGIQKVKIMLQDKEAARTRASFIVAVAAWLAGAGVCATHHSHIGVPFFSTCGAASYGLVLTLFFVYEVEKQARLCKPHERMEAMVNVHNDILLTFFDMCSCQRFARHGTDLGSASTSAPVEDLEGDARVETGGFAAKTPKKTEEAAESQDDISSAGI